MSRGHLANTSQLNLILLYEPSAFRWGKLYFYTSVNMNIFEKLTYWLMIAAMEAGKLWGNCIRSSRSRCLITSLFEEPKTR